jgi:hypothetical protein
MESILRTNLGRLRVFLEIEIPTRKTHPPLVNLHNLASLEMRAGTPWDEALCNLSERTGMDEMSVDHGLQHRRLLGAHIE